MPQQLNALALKRKAAEIRLSVLDAIAGVGKGHIGGAFSCTEILVSLYHGGLLRFDPDNPKWPHRDRFILSKGHAGIVLCAILADLGFFPKDELNRFNRQGLLGEHPDHRVPGVELMTGSLGHGLGIGAGMAMAAKMDGVLYCTWVLLGDGECYEGSVWEAANFAAHHELDNLIVVVDRNTLIVNGFTEDVNRLEPFADKWQAFGWEVSRLDGHLLPNLLACFQDARDIRGKRPKIIIADTVKGKGISFMEGQVKWHHGTISGELYCRARAELIAAIAGESAQ